MRSLRGLMLVSACQTYSQIRLRHLNAKTLLATSTASQGINCGHATTCELSFVAFTESAQAKALVTRYFEHYASFVPALVDPSLTPETCYEQSEFLFWTIICTGARKYAEDPTVLERVAQRIMEIARTALFTIQNPIPAIQAALILCLWSAPIDTMWKDPSHVVSGTALQLAVQNGLHSMGREQDFRRVNVSNNSKSTLRGQLWVHCVVISQRFVPLSDSNAPCGII